MASLSHAALGRGRSFICRGIGTRPCERRFWLILIKSVKNNTNLAPAPRASKQADEQTNGRTLRSGSAGQLGAFGDRTKGTVAGLAPTLARSRSNQSLPLDLAAARFQTKLGRVPGESMEPRSRLSAWLDKAGGVKTLAPIPF